MAIDLTPPLAVRLAYQNSQMATGTYTQAGSQVFGHLVSPPASGIAAEAASDTAAHNTIKSGTEAANGVVTRNGATRVVSTTTPQLLDATRQRDGMRDTADSASGNHFPA